VWAVRATVSVCDTTQQTCQKNSLFSASTKITVFSWVTQCKRLDCLPARLPARPPTGPPTCLQAPVLVTSQKHSHQQVVLNKNRKLIQNKRIQMYVPCLRCRRWGKDVKSTAWQFPFRRVFVIVSYTQHWQSRESQAAGLWEGHRVVWPVAMKSIQITSLLDLVQLLWLNFPRIPWSVHDGHWLIGWLHACELSVFILSRHQMLRKMYQHVLMAEYF